jgi:hypothetical protein
MEQRAFSHAKKKVKGEFQLRTTGSRSNERRLIQRRVVAK